MADKKTEAGRPGEFRGRTAIWVFIAGSVLFGLFFYFIVPNFATSYLEKRPVHLERAFDAIGEALTRYAADHEGRYPPPADILEYRRNTKNLAKVHAYGLTVVNLRALTTPVAYLNPATAADPFAMPDQFAPPACLQGRLGDSGEGFLLLWSPGPNLLYEIRPAELEGAGSAGELRRRIVPFRYDPTNGAASAGDSVRLSIFPLDSEHGLD